MVIMQDYETLLIQLSKLVILFLFPIRTGVCLQFNRTITQYLVSIAFIHVDYLV